MKKFKIETIVIEHKIEDNPDTSFIGEYTSDLGDGVIIRQYDKFYEDLTEEEIEEINERNREYTGFKPYAGGEKVGTKEYKEYGLQDYKRMEQLSNGDFTFIGISAYANIYFEENGVRQYQKITSGGIWGIESDDKSGVEEFEKEQIEDLKHQLEHLNIDVSNFYDIKITKNVIC